jgi:hypothetical protein
MFKKKHNPRLDKVMRNFERLDDYLQNRLSGSLIFWLNVRRRIRGRSSPLPTVYGRAGVMAQPFRRPMSFGP